MEQVAAPPMKSIGARMGWAVTRAALALPLGALGILLFYCDRFGRLTWEAGPALVFGVLAAGIAVLLGGERNRETRRRVYRYVLILALMVALFTRSSLIFGSSEEGPKPIAWFSTSLSICLIAAGIACTLLRGSRRHARDASEAEAAFSHSKQKSIRRLGKLLWLTVLGTGAASVALFTFMDDLDASFMLGYVMYFTLHLGVLFLASWTVLAQDSRYSVGFARIAAVILFLITAFAFAHAFPMLIWRNWS